MLLVVDVGNTNTVVGLLDGARVVHQWRVSTLPRTTDEFGLLLLQLLAHERVAPEHVSGVAVPELVHPGDARGRMDPLGGLVEHGPPV